MSKMIIKKHKVYREFDESWFYKKFIKNTVNDNFITPTEALEKESNQRLIKKVKRVKSIKG